MSDIKIWDVNDCGIIYVYPDGCFKEKQEGEVVLKKDHIKAMESKDIQIGNLEDEIARRDFELYEQEKKHLKTSQTN